MGQNKPGNHLREADDREGENQRHDAAARNPDGNDGRLAAVHFSALDLLGVLDGNLTFGKIDEYDRKENDRATRARKPPSSSICVAVGAGDLLDFRNDRLTAVARIPTKMIMD